MDRLSRIANRIVNAQNEALELDETALAVARFLKDNSDINDEDFHEWAEGEKYDVEDAEEAAYRLASVFSSFLLAGRANDKGTSADDVDEHELEMGRKVEMEHTDDERVAERISLDHLAEAPVDAPLKYYTGLKMLERIIEALVDMDKDKANEKIEQLRKFVDDLEK